MKQIILFLITLMFTFSVEGEVQAQVTANSSFLVGGSVSYNTSGSTVEITQDGLTEMKDGPSTSTFTFEPVAAYFIMPNLALGVQLSFTKEKVTSEVEDYNVQNLLIGPLARYYYPIMGNKAAVFMEIDAAFGSSSGNNGVGSTATSTDNTVAQFGFGPGITFFIDDLVGLEGIAKYNFTKSTATVESPTISYESISNGNEFDFQIGLQFYFTR